MKLKVLGVIPARLGSKRFAGKLLYPVDGQPLLYYVWRGLTKSKELNRLVIATDDKTIKRAAEDFGADVVMTSSSHETGSDRVAEAARKLGGEIVVNIQGDNFGLRASLVDRVVRQMKRHRTIEVATLAYRLTMDADLLNPDIVKVVRDSHDNALWFSRQPLPYLRHRQSGAQVAQFRYFGHIGVYFFRRAALLQYAKLDPGENEVAESLEQLRLLENGEPIRLFYTKAQPIIVDRPADIRLAAKSLNV